MVSIAPSSALAFGAAVCIASQAVTIKAGIDRAKTTAADSPAFAAALTSIVVSVVIYWVLLVGQGVPTDAFSLGNAWPFVVAGVLNPAAFRLLYFRGIEEVGASIAAALMAINPLVATLLAVPVLGERVTAATALGVVCIVGGGVLIQLLQNASNADAADETDVVARELAAADARSMVYPVGAMVLLGVSYVLIKYGLDRFPNPVSGTAIAQTAALGVFLVILVTSGATRRRVGTVNRAAIAIFALAGVFTALAQLANFSALVIGSAVSVIPLFNTFPLLVLGFTYARARQLPKSPLVVGAVAAIVVGSVLIEIF